MRDEFVEVDRKDVDLMDVSPRMMDFGCDRIYPVPRP